MDMHAFEIQIHTHASIYLLTGMQMHNAVSQIIFLLLCIHMRMNVHVICKPGDLDHLWRHRLYNLTSLLCVIGPCICLASVIVGGILIIAIPSTGVSLCLDRLHNLELLRTTA